VTSDLDPFKRPGRVDFELVSDKAVTGSIRAHGAC